MLAKPLVPASFDVPTVKETPDFRLRVLTIHDVIKDYDAVMSSVERLTQVFGDNSGWPRGLTLEQDLIDLAWHQKEFQRRSSFAYTMMSLHESQCLGCVYIMPPYRGEFDGGAYDAAVFLWVRDSVYHTGLDDVLYRVVKDWMQEWPFQSVAYPGREIPWDQWHTLPV